MSKSAAFNLLEPHDVWQSFAALNAVPRPSKKEEKVIAFILNFGASLGLDTQADEVGNILIRKPASIGMEHKPIVCLQAHLDMVHQKNEATVFDFENQGIQMEISGDWVHAKGTTLGADNGLGVAAIMAVLKAKDILHGPLEALFTIDEETGMTGAKELAPNWLQAKYLLNLDTEDDDEIAIGCAGGIDITAKATFKTANYTNNLVAYELKVFGLQGGHSGMDIHRGFGNANLIANGLLKSFCERFELQLVFIKGGSLRNAIPREAKVVFIIPNTQLASFEAFAAVHIHEAIKQWSENEPGIKISLNKTATTVKEALSVIDSKAIADQIAKVHHGVYAMSTSVPDLVETSNNLAIVHVENGKVEISCLCRSSIARAKMDLAQKIKESFDLSLYKVLFSGDYPGWEPKPEGKLLKLLFEKYQMLFKEKPRVVACHAGLECGLLGKHYPAMEMISFGPTIRGAHSPEEKVSITSVQKFWYFFKEVLAEIS